MSHSLSRAPREVEDPDHIVPALVKPGGGRLLSPGKPGHTERVALCAEKPPPRGTTAGETTPSCRGARSCRDTYHILYPCRAVEKRTG